jgi:hypothetical protein
MFEWDDDNRAHVGRHGVEPEECEQALADSSVLLDEEYAVRGEWRAIMDRKDGCRTHPGDRLDATGRQGPRHHGLSRTGPAAA